MGLAEFIYDQIIYKKVNRLLADGHYTEAARECLYRCQLPKSKHRFCSFAQQILAEYLEKSNNKNDFYTFLHVIWDQNRYIKYDGNRIGAMFVKTCTYSFVKRMISNFDKKRIDHIYQIKNMLDPINTIMDHLKHFEYDFISYDIGPLGWAELLDQKGFPAMAAYFQIEIQNILGDRFKNFVTNSQDARNYIDNADKDEYISPNVVEELKEMLNDYYQTHGK